MKKIIKRFRKKFARVDKIFLAGFTFLTLLSLILGGIKPLWLFSTALGIGLIVWQVVRDE